MSLPKSLTTVTTLSKTLALVIFILMPVVGFLLGIQYQESITPIDVPVVRRPTPTPSPRVSAIIPADWKTYEDSQYGFSIKYPESTNKNIPTKQYLDNDLSAGYRLTLSPQSIKNPHDYFLLIVQKTKPGISLKDQWKIVKKNEHLQTEIPFIIGTLDIDGKNGLQLEDDPNLNTIVNTWNLVQLNDNFIILIERGNSEITNQILSTFKFTDGGATAIPSNKSSIVPINDQWVQYTNTNIGFSIKVPRKTVSMYGDCKYWPNESSYRPVPGAIIPIQILDDGDIVHLVAEYQYELSGATEKGGIHYYSQCNKTNVTTDKIRNLLKGDFIDPYLKFFSKKVENDQEIELFIKDNYGKDCLLGGKKLSNQPNTFSVSVGNTTNIDDNTKDCFINYGHTIRYHSAKHVIVAWNLGQACNFAYPTEETCLDMEMQNSFKFE